MARGFTFSLCEPMQDGGGIWQESGCLLVTLLRGNRRRAGIFSEGRFILNSDVPRCLLVHYQRIRRSRAGRLGVRVWDEDKILFGHEDEHKCADDDERTNQVETRECNGNRNRNATTCAGKIRSKDVPPRLQCTSNSYRICRISTVMRNNEHCDNSVLAY